MPRVATPPAPPGPPPGTPFFVVSVRVADDLGGPAAEVHRAAAVELVADRLWAFAPPAVEEIDDGDVTEVRAGFADASTAEEAAAAIERGGWGTVRTWPVADDGLDGWRAWARAERAGRFWVVPSWTDPPGDAEEADLLRIDPGRTFGSGSHPTTRLVLAVLEGLVRPGCSVLDVGTGSGVLAIGAARLGASSVVGIDVDPGSPAVAHANAASNGVADRVEAHGQTLAQVVGAQGRFDVVMANLLAPVIVELAPDLVGAVASGGVLVVSGLLADRWRPAVDALAGLDVAAVDEADGWVAVTLTRPNDA